MKIWGKSFILNSLTWISTFSMIPGMCSNVKPTVLVPSKLICSQIESFLAFSTRDWSPKSVSLSGVTFELILVLGFLRLVTTIVNWNLYFLLHEIFSHHCNPTEESNGTRYVLICRNSGYTVHVQNHINDDREECGHLAPKLEVGEFLTRPVHGYAWKDSRKRISEISLLVLNISCCFSKILMLFVNFLPTIPDWSRERISSTVSSFSRQSLIAIYAGDIARVIAKAYSGGDVCLFTFLEMGFRVEMFWKN